MKTKKRILFICKDRNTSYTPSFGLLNSCKFICNALEKHYIECKVVAVVDNNAIDKEVTSFQPTHVFIEALWVVPSKFNVLCALHPNVKWYVRIHSKVPFLANEGMAMGWIRDYAEISHKFKNLHNSANNMEVIDAFKKTFDINIKFHPNIYAPPDYGFTDTHKSNSHIIDVGCFGAIRPMKNQLLQAMAAVAFGNEINKKIRFHVNGDRVEMKGEATFRNIENVFKDTKHELIKHDWSEHKDFIKVVRQMDMGMQVSLSETFNIVAADFVWNNIPVVGSTEISWLSFLYKADAASLSDMVEKMKTAWFGKSVNLHRLNKWNLDYYNEQSTNAWLSVL
jgi:hypothetical protein